MNRHAVGEVVRVVDADTVHMRLDIGWGIVLLPRDGDGPGTVRVCRPDGGRFDASEMKTQKGRDGAAFVRRHVQPGDKLEVVSYGIDSFGRTLGSVTWANGTDWATAVDLAGFSKEVGK